MKRGSLVTIAVQGDHGKPRPGLIIQSDHFDQHPSVTILPLTSTLVAAPLFRVAMEPSEENGLAIKSQVMVDKAITVSREKLGTDIGQASYAVMQEIDRCLAVFLGIAR